MSRCPFDHVRSPGAPLPGGCAARGWQPPWAAARDDPNDTFYSEDQAQLHGVMGVMARIRHFGPEVEALTAGPADEL